MVDVTHDGHHRRPRLGAAGPLAGHLVLELDLLLERHHHDVDAEVGGELLGQLGLEDVVDVGHHAAGEHRGDQVLGLDPELVRELAHGHPLGEHHRPLGTALGEGQHLAPLAALRLLAAALGAPAAAADLGRGLVLGRVEVLHRTAEALERLVLVGRPAIALGRLAVALDLLALDLAARRPLGRRGARGPGGRCRRGRRPARSRRRPARNRRRSARSQRRSARSQRRPARSHRRPARGRRLGRRRRGRMDRRRCLLDRRRPLGRTRRLGPRRRLGLRLRPLGHRHGANPGVGLVDHRPRARRAQRVGRRPAQHAPLPGIARHRLVAQDDLARVGQLLARQDGLDDVGVDVGVVALDPHPDRLQLEDEVLVGDPHLLRQVLDPNLSHAFLSAPLAARRASLVLAHSAPGRRAGSFVAAAAATLRSSPRLRSPRPARPPRRRPRPPHPLPPPSALPPPRPPRRRAGPPSRGAARSPGRRATARP